RVAPRIGAGLVLRRDRLVALGAGGQPHGDQQGGDDDARPHRKRSRATLAARVTLSGAVPPKLVRLRTELATSRISKTAWVMRFSTACISARVSCAKVTPRVSASLTRLPVM